MTIKPAKLYSLTEICHSGWLKNKSYNGCKAEADKNKEILKPLILGEGEAKRIYIKGWDLLEYQKK